jgi:outer membrane protein assembly factor BamB
MELFGALLAVVLSAGSADDWPQWLGPHRDAVSPEVIAPWGGPLRVVWRHPIGEGHSSPIVAGGRVFLHSRVTGQEAEVVHAWDAETGRPLWHASYPRAMFSTPFGNGPRATPAAVGDRLFTFGITGILTCYEAGSGKQLWQVDTLKRFRAPNLRFGVSCSPLVERDKVLVNVGGKGASVVAFATNTGDVAWKSLDDSASYSSPILLHKPVHQAVFFTGRGLVGLDPTDGRALWKFPLVDLLSESSSTPARAGDLLLASTVTAGSVGIRLQEKDEKMAASLAWKNPLLTCYFSTPVAVGADQVYLVTGRFLPPIQATLYCIDGKTGKELWNRPRIGKYHASLLRTGDDKLLVLDDGGNLHLLQPDAKEYRELARVKVCGPTWAHPALAHGKLYVRDEKELICLQLKP